MSKELTVEEVLEKPEELISALERGESVTITKDGKEIATMDARNEQRGVRFPFRDFDFGPRPKNLRTDPVELIIEERDRERSERKWRS
jgi:antitoxin (DNA-binding transcriptional repressor) of toxin-antitoxin stability system